MLDISHALSMTNLTYIQAVDCRNPLKVHNSLIQKLCQTPNPVVTKDRVAVGLYQQSSSHVVKGYRCTKTQDLFYEVCGMFSHTKMYTTPTIGAPTTFTLETCRMAVQRLTYTREDGVMMPLSLNKKLYYSLVRHGSLHRTADDISCTGSTFYMQDEQVSSIVELVGTHVLVEEISVEISAHKAVDLTNNIELPSECVHTTGCQDSTKSYVISPAPECNLQHIRTLMMEQITIPTSHGDQRAFVSQQHKILLSVKEPQTAAIGCAPVKSYFNTEFPALKITIAETGSTQSLTSGATVDASVLDLELEIKVTNNYLSFYFESTLKEQLQTLGQRLCSITQEAVSRYERSPFHPNALIRIRGDVVQELICKPQRVEIRLGEHRGQQCYRDGIHGWIGNQPVMVQAVTHLVVEASELHQVSCDTKFPPIFSTAGSELVAAYPEIRIVDMKLGHLDEDFLHLNNMDQIKHQEFAGEYLYTAQEIAAFNDLLHFQRTRKEVLDSLVQDYCTGNEQCGPYQPDTGSSFSLHHLEQEVANSFDFLGQWKKTMERYGGYCSIVVLILVAMSIVYNVVKVIWLTVYRGLTCGRALQLGFLMSPTILNEISRVPETAATRPNPEDIPLISYQRTAPVPELPASSMHSAPVYQESNAIVPYYNN